MSSLDQLLLSMGAIMMFEMSASSLSLLVWSTSGRRRYALLLGTNGCPWSDLSFIGPRLDDKDIGTKLGLSEVNVWNCIAWIIYFLRLKDRQELVLYASAGS